MLVESILDRLGPGTAATESRRRPSILVVEDDPVVAGMLRSLLEWEDFGVAHAADGLRAIHRLDGLPADGILLDCSLPHVDGFGVLEAIRRHPSWRAVPVIMVSGRSDERDIVRAFAAGADDYVTKPFRPDELMCRLGRLVRCTA